MLEAAAAPATVSGEPFVIMPLGLRPREGDEQAMTREPGDLPSAVVTREHVGRGALTEANRASCDARGDWLRGDVPQPLTAEVSRVLSFRYPGPNRPHDSYQ